jgi:hypothetical protein
LAEFLDGHVQELSANAVINAIYNQIDEEGYDSSLFRDIIEHRKTKIVKETDEAQEQLNSNTNHCTTMGWDICIAWQDGSTSWHPLSDVKNSFQLQLAKYAKLNKLDNEPAFSWWVNHTLKKEKWLIKTKKLRYSKCSHKFSIYVPKTVQEALKIDQETNTTYWRDAINKEMTNNKMAFKFLEEDENIPISYKWIRCHMIFDVKMDFT